ncbi:MAG: autotransporter assembly complex protein TamA [Gemmatimonadales bacterium]
MRLLEDLRKERVPKVNTVLRFCLSGSSKPLLLVALAYVSLAGAGMAQDLPVRVRIEGISGAERRNALATMSIAGAASETAVSEARVRRLHDRAPREIALALEPFGYYRLHVEPELTRDQRRWTARYVVDPGPRVTVSKISIAVTGEGANETGFQDVLQRFPLTEGAPLSHAAYEMGKTRLVNRAAELGYLDGRFDTNEVLVDLESYTAVVNLSFATGQRYQFGSVSFDQDVVNPAVLQSYVTFRRGEPFSTVPLLALQSALSDSPYFSRVEVVPRRDMAQGLEVPIQVSLVPRRPQRYEVGAGYGTNTGPRGSFQVELRRLNRGGHRALGEISASIIEKKVSGRYVIPFGTVGRQVLSLAAGFARLTPSTSSSDAVIISTSLAHSRNRLQETLALSFQLEDFEVGTDSGTSNLLMPSASWSLTKANDRVFPTRGARLRLELQGAVRGFGSDASFGRIRANAKIIRAITGQTRLLARLDLGGTVTSQLRQLPPSIRFFAGGDQSVRGYEFRSLGPVDQAGNVIGGRVLAVASVEVDQQVVNRIMVAGFVDVGNAMDSASWDLEQGVGGGVRWLSPVGLVRLDLAVALSRAGNPLRLHITVGPDL